MSERDAERLACVFMYWELNSDVPPPRGVVYVLLHGCVALGEL